MRPVKGQTADFVIEGREVVILPWVWYLLWVEIKRVRVRNSIIEIDWVG
jgi:hypothetical protein